MKSVKLTHPTTGGKWMCPANAVDAWLAKGWKKADEAAKTNRKDQPNG